MFKMKTLTGALFHWDINLIPICKLGHDTLTHMYVHRIIFCLHAVPVSVDMILELILNQTITANLVLLVTAGLPYSGKSSIIRKVINAKGKFVS